MRRLATFAAAFSAAVFLTQYALPAGWLLPLAAGCGGLAVAAFALRGDRRARALLLAGGLAFGFLWCALYAAVFFAPAEALDGRVETAEALVLDYPEDTDYGVRTMVRLACGRFGVRTLLYLDASAAGLRPGDRVFFTARFTLASRVRGEEVEYYTAKGIFLRAFVQDEITVVPGSGSEARFAPVRLSRALGDSVNALFGAYAPLVLALTTGNRADLSGPFLSSLARSGLMHMVAVSGMHLSFLTGFLFLFLGRRRRMALAAVPLILFFMVMVGNTPSVVRAGIMQLILLAAPLLNREADAPTSLSFALMVLLLLNPYGAAHMGLQLSFAAMAGIFCFSERVYDALDARLPGGKKPEARYGPVRRFVLSTFAGTLGATVFTVPLTAWYFGYVSLIAPLSNLLTLWAVSYAFVGGLAAGLAGLLWLPLGQALALPTRPLVWYLTELIPVMGSWNYAAVSAENRYVVFWLFFAYAVLLIPPVSRLWRAGRCRIWVPFSALAGGLVFVLLFSRLSVSDASLTVTALDVGQGQCVALLTEERSVLVDCGGYDAGNIAADYLQGLGRGKVDLLILTHFHEDHANGLPQLFSRMEVAAVALPDIDPDSPRRTELLKLAEGQGTRLLWATRDRHLSFGDLRLTVYAPLGGGGGNEEGLAVLGALDAFSLLITGDMNDTVERMLVKYQPLPDISLLVAGHHGSRYSNSELLLDAVLPEVVVISAGRNNLYGHPAPEALERFAAAGIEVYRTDLSGSVTIRAR